MVVIYIIINYTLTLYHMIYYDKILFLFFKLYNCIYCICMYIYLSIYIIVMIFKMFKIDFCLLCSIYVRLVSIFSKYYCPRRKKPR